MKSITACFTGHRPFGLLWGYNETNESCIKFKKNLLTMLRNKILSGVSTFLTGMAEGFDMIAAEIIIELKKEFSNIKLIAIIPCLNQEKKWSINQQKRYWQILQNCDSKIVLKEKPSKECFNERNLYMVQHSDICIACWNGKPSGTGNTVKFAKACGCQVCIISPI